MSEEGNKTNPMVSPNPEIASEFSLSISINSAILSIGRGRALFSADGAATGQLAKEWTHSFVMSPQSLKFLTSILNITMEKYEEKFGEIKLPQESFSVETNESTS